MYIDIIRKTIAALMIILATNIFTSDIGHAAINNTTYLSLPAPPQELSTVWSEKEIRKLKPILFVSKNKEGEEILRWDIIEGASGYQIFFYDEEEGKYLKVKTVRGHLKTSILLINLNEELGGEYKVRGYRRIEKRLCFTRFSESIKVIS